jgi:DNA-binding NtrC family response regulator
VGSHESNDLALTDRTVSRFHCEIRLDVSGPRLHDLDSRNGTLLDGVRVADAWLRNGSLIRMGQSVLRFQLAEESNSVRLASRSHFGSLVGESVAMRAVFAVLERAAAASSTVLLQGETGTGKDLAAASIHEEGDRAKGPFVVVDCSAIPQNLLESELFGHEAGAFTGASQRRIGAFEAASGGTLFLDEVGELPLDLQPKLLRVLESRTIRRVGGQSELEVDVRIVAATNRDLREEVNEGRFRPDLYYRLAVLSVRIPPLRERPEDIPVLVRRILDSLGAGTEASDLVTSEFMARLQHAAFPGNVRQLRNYLEQCIALRETPPLHGPVRQSRGSFQPDPGQPYAEARRHALDEFEREYARALLERHGGNVSQAARAAGLNRVYLHRLLRRHGIRG